MSLISSIFIFVKMSALFSFDKGFISDAGTPIELNLFEFLSITQT